MNYHNSAKDYCVLVLCSHRTIKVENYNWEKCMKQLNEPYEDHSHIFGIIQTPDNALVRWSKITCEMN